MGKKYPTISFEPLLICKLRKDLEAVAEGGGSQVVKEVARLLLNDFNERFGEGAPGRVFLEHTFEGPNRRPRGVSYMAFLAAAVDPRLKNLDNMGLLDGPHYGDVRLRLQVIRQINDKQLIRDELRI